MTKVDGKVGRTVDSAMDAASRIAGTVYKHIQGVAPSAKDVAFTLASGPIWSKAFKSGFIGVSRFASAAAASSKIKGDTPRVQAMANAICSDVAVGCRLAKMVIKNRS